MALWNNSINSYFPKKNKLIPLSEQIHGHCATCIYIPRKLSYLCHLQSGMFTSASNLVTASEPHTRTRLHQSCRCVRQPWRRDGARRRVNAGLPQVKSQSRVDTYQLIPWRMLGGEGLTDQSDAEPSLPFGTRRASGTWRLPVKRLWLHRAARDPTE